MTWILINNQFAVDHKEENGCPWMMEFVRNAILGTDAPNITFAE